MADRELYKTQELRLMKRLSIKGLPDDWLIHTTRYRGSKRKILSWIWEYIKDSDFDSALDLFGGTGVVALLFKRMGKRVYYNDYLVYNYLSGVALIENKSTILTDEDLEFILSDHSSVPYGTLIADTFKGYYFLGSENSWLDRTLANISALNRFYTGRVLQEKRALAIWSLGQACLIKRPFNLFHRKNLNLRLGNVTRQFGNKTTWETPFPTAFRRFAEEANHVVFDNGRDNQALCSNVFSLEQPPVDLVYIDPPYFFEKPTDADYRDLYHFLEGISQYNRWPDLIDYSSYNLRLKGDGVMQWPSQDPEALTKLYSSLIERYKGSIVVISHKSRSLVSIGEIRRMLQRYGKKVHGHRRRYNYALNRKNSKPRHNLEWLIIGE